MPDLLALVFSSTSYTANVAHSYAQLQIVLYSYIFYITCCSCLDLRYRNIISRDAKSKTYSKHQIALARCRAPPANGQTPLPFDERSFWWESVRMQPCPSSSWRSLPQVPLKPSWHTWPRALLLLPWQCNPTWIPSISIKNHVQQMFPFKSVNMTGNGKQIRKQKQTVGARLAPRHHIWDANRRTLRTKGDGKTIVSIISEDLWLLHVSVYHMLRNFVLPWRKVLHFASLVMMRLPVHGCRQDTGSNHTISFFLGWPQDVRPYPPSLNREVRYFLLFWIWLKLVLFGRLRMQRQRLLTRCFESIAIDCIESPKKLFRMRRWCLVS